jgi:hypothetical protein
MASPASRFASRVGSPELGFPIIDRSPLPRAPFGRLRRTALGGLSVATSADELVLEPMRSVGRGPTTPLSASASLARKQAIRDALMLASGGDSLSDRAVVTKLCAEDDMEETSPPITDRIGAVKRVLRSDSSLSARPAVASGSRAPKAKAPATDKAKVKKAAPAKGKDKASAPDKGTPK